MAVNFKTDESFFEKITIGAIGTQKVFHNLAQIHNLAQSGHIVVLGNSPITESYIKKVDFLKNLGVIQSFWSLNPTPKNSEYIKNTPKLCLQTILQGEQLFINCKELINNDMNDLSSMISKMKFGEIIIIASQETTDIATTNIAKTDIAKAEKFLTLIRS